MKAASALAAITAALVVGPALPAAADPAVPTNYASEVVAVEPAVGSLHAEVVGGDAFLSVEVEAGYELTVLGYRDEPYLRIDRDGAVWRNRNSPATYLNDDRYGQSEIPAGVDAAAPADWEQVGSGGTWSWHDHRIHWMSPDQPPQIEGNRPQEVFAWEVPVLIDDDEVTVHGRLVWTPDVSPFPALAVGLVGLVPLAALGRYPKTLPAATAALAAVVGTVGSIGQWLANPPDARGFPVTALFLVGALALAVWSLRSSPERAVQWSALSGVLLAVWGWSQLGTLVRPVVPSVMPTWFDRVAVALALLAGSAVLVLALIRSRRASASM